MLIVYRKSDGLVVSVSGTNMLFPLGPAFDDEVKNALRNHAGVKEDYGEIRLHDVNDNLKVKQVLDSGPMFIVAGEIVFSQKPVPVVVPPAPTVEAAVKELQSYLKGKDVAYVPKYDLVEGVVK